MRFLTLHFWAILGLLCCFSNAKSLDVAENIDAIPSCAFSTSNPSITVDCLTTLVPKYGCTLTNATCICANPPLIEEAAICAFAACNVTESFQLVKYQSDSCGVKNDKSLQTRQIYSLCIELSLTVVFVAARFYSRISLAVGIGPDDWMILAALAAYTIDSATGILIPLNGFGQHMWYLNPGQIERSLLYSYISEPIYLLAITLTKVSVLLFLRRIFPNKRVNMVIWAVMGFIVLTNTISMLTLTFQCLPFHGNWTNWEYKVAPIKCLDQNAAIIVAAIMSLFHDILVVLTPLPTLWNLNLNIRKKIDLLFMFSIGTFVIACSLIRLAALIKIVNSTDPSWDQSWITIWSGLETCVGIMCTCLPAIRSLISNHFPSLKTSINTSEKTMPVYNSRNYAGGSRALSSTQKMRMSQAGFFELDERGGVQMTDGNSSLSKQSSGSITPLFKCEAGILTTSIGMGSKEEGEGKGIVITTHIKQKRSQSPDSYQ